MVQELSEFNLAGVFPDGVKGERVSLPSRDKEGCRNKVT